MISEEAFMLSLIDLNEYSDKLIVNLGNTAQDIHRWLKSLYSEREDVETTDTIKFPKTPSAIRRTRRKPNVETITEDDEVTQFEVRGSSVLCDVSLMNVSSASTYSTRSSRAASRNAHLKISAQSKQTLVQKLRRPTRSKPGVAVVQPLPPPTKTRRTGRQKTTDTLHDEARPSIIIVEQTEADNGIRKSAAKRKVSRVVATNVSPVPLLVVAQPFQSPDMFADEEVANEEVKVEATRPEMPKPVAAPRTISPLVTAQQCKSPQVFNPYNAESVKKRVMAYEMLGTLSEEGSPVHDPPAAAENVPMRVTRTKTRALARQTKDLADEQKKEQSTLQKLAHNSLKKAKRVSLAKDQRLLQEQRLNSSGKENSILVSDGRHHIIPPNLHISSVKSKPTPLTNSKPVRLNVLTSANRIHTNNNTSKNMENKSSSNIVSNYDTFITKTAKPNVEEIEEKKREERIRKEEKVEEAQKKRKELLESKREEQRKKREEKQIKAMQAREALEREKVEQKQRMEREKEEKARLLAEREEKQREELARRKQQALQKVHEIEERRKQEEAHRLARIREEEEEKRKAELQRKRDEAEAERQYLKRLAQEKEAAVAAAKQQIQAAAAAKKKAVEAPPLNGTFTLGDKKVERPPLKPESEVNYYVADLSEGESSSDEDHPRKKTPAWADHTLLKEQYKLQELIPLAAWNCMFSSHAHTPDLARMFNNKKLGNLKRTSSAVWRTPPRFSRMPKH